MHCLHVFIGSCYKDGHAVALGSFMDNPEATSRITLLKSSHEDSYYDALPFQTVAFPFVFGARPNAETICQSNTSMALEHGDQPESGTDPKLKELTSPLVSRQAIIKEDAVAKWQSAAGGRTDRAPTPQGSSLSTSPVKRVRLQQSKWQLAWGPTARAVLLNVNNERVDPKLQEVEHEISENMLDRIEVRRFCVFYHLLGTCINHSKGRTCKYVHGPELSTPELVVLRGFVRQMPCDIGSGCRRVDCIYGHICPDQPGCSKERCSLRRFHGADSTAVKVWRT